MDVFGFSIWLFLVYYLDIWVSATATIDSLVSLLGGINSNQQLFCLIRLFLHANFDPCRASRPVTQKTGGYVEARRLIAHIFVSGANASQTVWVSAFRLGWRHAIGQGHEHLVYFQKSDGFTRQTDPTESDSIPSQPGYADTEREMGRRQSPSSSRAEQGFCY